MVEHVRVKTTLGLNVAVVIDLPQLKKSLPWVLLLHGTTGWKEEGHIDSLAKELAAHGICAVRLDAPGSGESEGTWQDDYRLSSYLEAVDDVYDYVSNNYQVDTARVGIWGHSMGGQVAAFVVARHPGRFSAFCGTQLSPGKVSSMIAKGDPTEEGVTVETEIFGTVVLPKAYFDDRAQYITADAVKKLSLPQLYIAGTQDDIVPASSVKETYEAAPKPKQYIEFPTGHDYKNDSENLEKINNVTVEFFKTQLLK